MKPLRHTAFNCLHETQVISEGKWLIRLLRIVLEKIAKEGSIGSMPVEGVPVG